MVSWFPPYISIIAELNESNLRFVDSYISLLSLMRPCAVIVNPRKSHTSDETHEMIVRMSVSLKLVSTWTHITFLCVLFVLLLLFINFDLRL